ncbi:APC family permease [Streptomyces vinaceus]|uniref:APC family permease n=1 Tax=Streptomyces vinaceus TaxID=1960 RepID=UPI0036B7C6F9
MPENVSAVPRKDLTPVDVSIMVVGIVLGIGIFKTPSLVARYAGDETVFVSLWLLGGLITVIGSVCYAELGSARPDAGGEYAFLREAYGSKVALLFAWARCTVIQPGAIAAAAFVMGDYANVVWPLGAPGPGIYALASVIVFTLVNHVGTTPGKLVQKAVEVIVVLSMLGIVISAFVARVPEPGAGTPQTTSWGGAGLAMMFILLTYGGWNEAAYLSGELQDARRNMARALVVGVLVVVAVSLAINFAYLHVLGLDGIRNSEAVGAAMMRVVAGDAGATGMCVVVGCCSLTTLKGVLKPGGGGYRAATPPRAAGGAAIGGGGPAPAGATDLRVVIVLSTLTTLNGLIITGARSYYALGRDVGALRSVGTWRRQGSTPANALLLQGAVSAVLVVFGAFTRAGFRTMVAYTSPVFWFFMLLVALSLYVFRRRETGGESHYRVPLYPVTPALFALSCLWVLCSSLLDAGRGSIVGVAVLLAGTPLLFLRAPRPR